MKQDDKFYYWDKKEIVYLSKHFRTKEFTCSCKYPDCKDQKISKELVDKLEFVREGINTAIEITSGYRCAKHQKDLQESGLQTAKGQSSHELGIAADIRAPSLRVVELLPFLDHSFDNVGIASRFAHVDMRPKKPDGSKRRWYYR